MNFIEKDTVMEANKERFLQKTREWCNCHKEKRREIARNWNKAHRGQIRIYARKHYQLIKHTEKHRLNVVKSRQGREARLNNVIHIFTIRQWRVKINTTLGICPACKDNVGKEKLTLDHIYPLKKASEDYLITGIKRRYTINDIQPLCLSCNSSKRDSLPSMFISNLPTS